MRNLSAITRYSIFVLSYLLYGLPAHADFAADPPQVIHELDMGWGGEGVYVVAEIKPSQCSATSYFMPIDAPMFKENYSALLTAFQSGEKLQLWYNGCESDGRALLKAVSLQK